MHFQGIKSGSNVGLKMHIQGIKEGPIMLFNNIIQCVMFSRGKARLSCVF